MTRIFIDEKIGIKAEYYSKLYSLSKIEKLIVKSPRKINSNKNTPAKLKANYLWKIKI
ncbi:MAG: hypothetical protein H5T85_07945 [Actinobacteria bacterium]|nr:hypothetical protein [Actinomycetota bacterium]